MSKIYSYRLVAVNNGALESVNEAGASGWRAVGVVGSTPFAVDVLMECRTSKKRRAKATDVGASVTDADGLAVSDESLESCVAG
jgi:hypothetical protein